ncbi:MAG: hypothetical protein K2Z81_02735, partial [Cyanobacteria bacterium]|nr:hypothetical protein [Cyanobacteriota bacterium]
MEILFKRFSLPKKASTFMEYQDATYPQGRDYSEPCIESHRSDDEFRCALADGATDAVFSKHWAELLVAGYAANEWSEGTMSPASLAGIKDRWHSHVAVKELPWYTMEKAKLGAAAALVTLRISAVGRRWSGVAIGDSCLFHIRNGAVITRFPEMTASEFSNICELLSSSKEATSLELVRRHENDSWLPGDCFYMMSDALACWFTRQLEEGKHRRAISSLAKIKSQAEFERFASEERERTLETGSRSLHDDDTTLIIVEIKDGARSGGARLETEPEQELVLAESVKKRRRLPVILTTEMHPIVPILVTACFTALLVVATLSLSGWLQKPIHRTADRNKGAVVTTEKTKNGAEMKNQTDKNTSTKSAKESSSEPVREREPADDGRHKKELKKQPVPKKSLKQQKKSEIRSMQHERATPKHSPSPVI